MFSKNQFGVNLDKGSVIGDLKKISGYRVKDHAKEVWIVASSKLHGKIVFECHHQQRLCHIGNGLVHWAWVNKVLFSGEVEQVKQQWNFLSL